jgi:SOS-response transcriptional repressor LexA
MKEGLTRQQTEVLSFIKAFVRAKGYTPSYREIALGQIDDQQILPSRAHSNTHGLVVRLEERGYLQRGRKGRERTISLVE